MNDIAKCRVCGNAASSGPACLGSRRYSCNTEGCVEGPFGATDHTARIRWNRLMRPTGQSVEWTTRPTDVGYRVQVVDADGADLPAELSVKRFGLLSDLVVAGPCTLTITAALTEAEPPKRTAPTWCTDNGDGGYAILATRCATDGKANRDDCDGCAYYVAADDTSPVPSDVARLYRMFAHQRTRLDRHSDQTAHNTATLFALGNRLDELESPEPVEPADSVEADEPTTRSVRLYNMLGEYVGQVDIPEESDPDLIPWGGRLYKPRHSEAVCGAFDDIEKGVAVVRPVT